MVWAAIILLFIGQAATVIYFLGEMEKLRLLKEETKQDELNKIPIDEQWNEFLAYDGRRREL